MSDTLLTPDQQFEQKKAAFEGALNGIEKDFKGVAPADVLLERKQVVRALGVEFNNAARLVGKEFDNDSVEELFERMENLIGPREAPQNTSAGASKGITRARPGGSAFRR